MIMGYVRGYIKIMNVGTLKNVVYLSFARYQEVVDLFVVYSNG